MGRLDKYKQNLGDCESLNSGRAAIIPVWLQVFFGLEMAGVIAAAFLWLPPAKGFAAPEAARIIVFHVPAAMVAVLAYIISTVYAIIYLSKGGITADIKSSLSASLGFIFTVLATITGMIFARMQWGAAWNWDPRETSILMLMIVYAAYFALRSAIPGSTARARISAVYNIMACLVMPYFVFLMPRIMGGLHPTTTLSDSNALAPQYRIVLGCATLGYIFLYVWIFRLTVRMAEHKLSNHKIRKLGK